MKYSCNMNQCVTYFLAEDGGEGEEGEEEREGEEKEGEEEADTYKRTWIAYTFLTGCKRRPP